MDKFAAQIESEMALLMSGELKKDIQTDDAMALLSKAKDLLECAGIDSYSSEIVSIMRKTATEDESDIEVSV